MRFMNISQGSLEECRNFLILAKGLGFGESNSILNQLEEVNKLLDAYYRSIHESM